MILYNFYSAYPLVETLYGVEIEPSEFEDIAMVGWELINNKHTQLYRFIGDTTNCELKLPCNVTGDIESVHIPVIDAQKTSSSDDFDGFENRYIERYIERWKNYDEPFDQRGKLIKYKEGDNTLYFGRDYKDVMVIYHGILVDDENGLPKITDKEQKAIAAYAAYVALYKDGIRKRNGDSIQLATSIKADWIRLCNSARIPEHLSQNDMNTILDAKARWDRKQYGKSLLPMI